MNGFSQNFGNEIVRRSQCQRCEPKTQHVVTKPPVDGGLLHSKVQTGNIGNQKQNGKPQQASCDIPDRHVQVFDFSLEQGQPQGKADQRTGHNQQNVNLPGVFEPLQAI